MLNQIAFILLLFCTLNLFGNTDTKGYLRFGIQKHVQIKTHYDASFGGKVKIISPKFYSVKAAVAFYSSNALAKAHNEGVKFYGDHNQNVTLLGEAYFEASYKKTDLKIGRQVIDTPFADSDDIGMIPNLFEAITLIDNTFEDSLFFFSYINKMAGIDAAKIERFSKIGKEGVFIAGAAYEGVDNLSLEGWYYDIDKNTKAAYFQSRYEDEYKYGGFTIGAQYANERFAQDRSASVWGVMSEIDHDDFALTLSAAYNKTLSRNNTPVRNFFGGGPFFSSGEHLTVADIDGDGDILFLGLSFDVSKFGARNLMLSFSNLWINGEENKKLSELDFVVGYSIFENLSIDMIYSDIDDKNEKNNSFKNFRAYVNYLF